MAIGHVEAGELVVSMDGAVSVIRGVAPEAPVEIIAANAQFTPGPGDSRTVPPHTGGLNRNNGPDPAQFAAMR
jgi:hypothetical protein